MLRPALSLCALSCVLLVSMSVHGADYTYHLPDNRTEGDFFGEHVVIDGDWMAAGARKLDASGEVHLLHRGADGTWAPAGILAPADLEAGALFGYALALQDDTLVVGASQGTDGPGAVYLFERQPDDTWQQVARLSEAGSESFGAAVALDGDTLLVGAPLTTVAVGRVYAYTRQPDGQWTRTQTILAEQVPTGTGAAFRFGGALDVEGDTAIIAADNDSTEATFQGSVFVYARDPDTGQWASIDRLVPPQPMQTALFGLRLDLDGPRIAVGTNFHATRLAGEVFVFERDPTRGWQYDETLVLPAETALDNAMQIASVALDGAMLAVGVPWATTDGMAHAGRVDLYVDTGDTWVLRETLALDSVVQRDAFGIAVDLDHDQLISGAYIRNLTRGGIYMFELDDLPPSEVVLEPATVVAASPVSTVVGTLSTVDRDSTEHSYELVADGTGRFALEGDQITVADPARLMAGQTLLITVRTTDPSLQSYDQTLTIEVVDELPPPPLDDDADTADMTDTADTGEPTDTAAGDADASVEPEPRPDTAGDGCCTTVRAGEGRDAPVPYAAGWLILLGLVALRRREQR